MKMTFVLVWYEEDHVTVNLENYSILKLMLLCHSSFIFRLILGHHEESRAAHTFSKVFFKPLIYFFPTLLSIPDETLAKAMINSAVVHPSQPIKEIYENKKIHEMAKFNIENTE